MKKFFLSAGALLLAVGLVLSWVGVRMGGETMATVRLFGHSWNVYSPSVGWGVSSTTVDRPASATPSASLAPSVERADAVRGTGSDATAFTSLSVDLDLGDVTVTAGEDYGVEIRSWGAGYEVEHWYSGGTLYIESNDSDSLLPADCGSEVTVFVPRDVWLESLYVDLDLGTLTLAGLSMEYAELNLDLGSLTGEALTVTTSFQVEASLGEVHLFGDLGEHVDISADLGDVQLGLSRPVSDYSWELEADLGSITVDGREQRLGTDHEVTGGRGNRLIEVDADLGSITLDFDQDFSGEPSQATSQAAPPSAWAERETTVTEATAVEDVILSETAQ